MFFERDKRVPSEPEYQLWSWAKERDIWDIVQAARGYHLFS
jgi:hypothetical protein